MPYDNSAAFADLCEQAYSGNRGAKPTALDPADPGESPRRQNGKPVADSLSGAGAAKLAETIRKYWRDRNHEVEVTVVPTDGFGTIYSIRSNLLDGKPRKISCTPPHTNFSVIKGV